MCMRCSFYCPKAAIKIGLFERWKVNGAYNFNNPNDYEDEVHKKYCQKSYIRYFEECNQKISQAKTMLEETEEQEEIEDVVKA